MAVSWPRMAAAPPPGYVAFVGRHLGSLRRQAARVVGDGHADELYPDVLADVAGAWGRLSLLGRLGRAEAAEKYLRRAFARRARRWPPDEDAEMDIEVWGVREPPWADIALRRPERRFVPSNAAVRLAPYLRPEHPPEVGPDIEAAVAWWHAYEDRRRRWLLVGLAALLVVAAVLVRIQRDLALGGW